VKERYLFELGGENTELGKYEALELLKTENYSPELILDCEKIVVIEVSGKIKARVVQRLAMTKRLSRIIFYDKAEEIDAVVKKIDEIDIGKCSFAIRSINKKKNSETILAKKLGEKVPLRNKINLTMPDVKILYYSDKVSIVSIWNKKKETYYKKCLEHHIKHRPFFSPISIHPRIARSMVNLSNCSLKHKIIDPFCGTGGILIEIANMEIEGIGIDILDKMVEYSTGNLKHYNLTAEIIKGDIQKLEDCEIDAIVTDPPYGISTTTQGEGVDELMLRSLSLFSEKLKSGQRLVMAISKPELVQSKNFRMLYQFEWYIHKSLTRNIMVMEKC
jgi:tRNA (guanine10-N2)-dimethyltransferase